jgi:hypothetical protein
MQQCGHLENSFVDADSYSGCSVQAEKMHAQAYAPRRHLAAHVGSCVHPWPQFTALAKVANQSQQLTRQSCRSSMLNCATRNVSPSFA